MIGVHEAQQLNIEDFNIHRDGFEYRLSGSYEQINITEFGDTTSAINTVTHTLLYFHQSYLSRLGFKLGLEVFDVNFEEQDTSIYLFTPKINFNIFLGVFPDFLYLVPSISIGYVIGNFDQKELYFTKPSQKWGVDLLLEYELGVHIRINKFEIISGVTFKYVNDIPQLNNFYPFVGISFNFNRN